MKALEGRLLDDGRFLYARTVDPARLDPRFPWLVQDAAPWAFDAPVVFVAGACTGFRFARPATAPRNDWRTAINTDACVWESWPIGEGIVSSTRAFMAAAGLTFGRLDFVTGAGGAGFLEVNPNGQYGWLDGPELVIHRIVLRSLLDPRASIR